MWSNINWQELITYLIAIAGFAFNIILLILNNRDIREIRNHQRALKQFEEKLTAVRPLYSTLYINNEEIMDLAVDFVKSANEIFALGTIENLKDIEMLPNEKEGDFRKRLELVDTKTRAYIAATTEFILSGHEYCRIFNFEPAGISSETVNEVLANVNYFSRLMESYGSVSHDIRILLYHNTETARGVGDFHFRCSDKQVVIRVGSRKNGYANSAIAITDTKVVDQFRRYYESMINDPLTKIVSIDDLRRIQKILLANDLKGLSVYLKTLPSARKNENNR